MMKTVDLLTGQLILTLLAQEQTSLIRGVMEQQLKTLSGLAAGSYTCNISDLDNFCDDNITVDVLFNPGFTLQSLSTDENCGDGVGEY